MGFNSVFKGLIRNWTEGWLTKEVADGLSDQVFASSIR